MGELKGEFCNASGLLSRDDFQAFDDTWDALMLDPRIFAFSVLSNDEDVQVLEGVGEEGKRRKNR